MTDLLKLVIGYETGDPDRIAAVILDLSRRDDLPDHLVLGSDALAFLKVADEKRRQDGETWEAIGRSIDFDDADFAVLDGFGDIQRCPLPGTGTGTGRSKPAGAALFNASA
ncbi:hypothetical protein FJU08_04800 [Martelella alba]|uniref:Uncharacterized protein n=1 Tax=Martelella alba TaxID=2590451 RepID=A0A506UD14_9HYPH|nr:hypothetical protein [Martelella alba]TPW32332.1 hypothetical protein FJU08_04800 [Martelella alba]